jgi:thiamine kinase-like enzyme
MEDSAPKQALDHFVIDRKSYRVEAHNQGYIHNSFKVFEEGQPVFILQQLNDHVFPNVSGVMENLQQVLPLLKGEGYHPVSYLYTKSRLPFYRDGEGRYWRLMTYVQKSTSFDFTSDPAIAFETGRVLGLFHKLAAQVKAETITPVLPGFHDLTKRKAEFFEILPIAKHRRMEESQGEIRFAKELLEELLDNSPSGLPLRVCHNDTKLNNFLFSSETGKGLCLIDLDTVMPGFFHFDTGDAIRTLANPNPEDEKNLEAITFDLQMVKAFLKGIHQSGLPLEEPEKGAIVYGAVLMPFLHGLRALTDYLANDRYYRVAYPEQNLDRCRSLFALVDKTRNKQAALTALVKEIL